MIDVRRSAVPSGDAACRRARLVVVANRLPVDDSVAPGRRLRVAAQPGRPGQRPAPDPAADARRPGSAGPAAPAPAPSLPRHRRRADARRSPLDGRGRARPLRGLRQLHPVAALPRRRRAAGLPPPLVGGVPAGQPAVRRGGRRGRRAGRRRSGCRTTTCSWCPALLRELRPDLLIGFFLHVPFPPPELFMQLPRRAELLRGHARRRPGRLPAAAGRAQLRPARRQAARRCRPPTTGSRSTGGRCGSARSRSRSTSPRWRRWPAARTWSPRAGQLRADLGDPQRVLLSVDRLDYTKGIEHRLKAYSELLPTARSRSATR